MNRGGLRDHLRHLMSWRATDEDKVADYAAAQLVRAGFHVYMEDPGNLFAWREHGALCLNAHLDSDRNGIGADDRCGIAAILTAVNQCHRNVRVLLTTQEEIGGVGAQEVPVAWWEGVELCASFDRHGNTDIITHYAGKQLAPDPMLERVAEVARAAHMDVCLTSSQSMADAHTFADHVPAVNIATGFYYEHTGREYYVPDDVGQAAEVARLLMLENWDESH